MSQKYVDTLSLISIFYYNNALIVNGKCLILPRTPVFLVIAYERINYIFRYLHIEFTLYIIITFDSIIEVIKIKMNLGVQ